jgi:flagellar FliL protein
MADNMAEATENQVPSDAPAARSPLVTVAKIGAFVVVILTIEALIAFLFIPSSGDVSAMAEARYGTGDVAADPVAHMVEDTSNEPTAEIDLEDYSVTAYQPLSNTTLRIDFHLYGTVAQSETAEFEKLFDENKQRLREQVIVTIRSSEITDLTDAGLGLIKRKLHDKINRTIGKSLVKSVIVSDFSFVEQ